MTRQILQINYNFSVSKGEYENGLCKPGAPLIANVLGLLRKVWLMNEEKKEAGGIYLFEDEVSVQKLLPGGDCYYGEDPSCT